MRKSRKRVRAPLSRSQIMSRIKGRDTGPEMAVRRALRARGIGYRVHVAGLPGRPDVVLPGCRLAIFVHGCFWHRHPGCDGCSDPKSSSDFWQRKFRANVERDRRKTELLRRLGWTVGVVWECETARTSDLDLVVKAVEEIRAGGISRPWEPFC